MTYSTTTTSISLEILGSTSITPFKSFLPLAGKMLTYLEAIRNPKKHIVKTFAIGNTAILIVPKRDSPATPTPASEAA